MRKSFARALTSAGLSNRPRPSFSRSQSKRSSGALSGQSARLGGGSDRGPFVRTIVPLNFSLASAHLLLFAHSALSPAGRRTETPHVICPAETTRILRRVFCPQPRRAEAPPKELGWALGSRCADPPARERCAQKRRWADATIFEELKYGRTARDRTHHHPGAHSARSMHPRASLRPRE